MHRHHASALQKPGDAGHARPQLLICNDITHYWKTDRGNDQGDCDQNKQFEQRESVLVAFHGCGSIHSFSLLDVILMRGLSRTSEKFRGWTVGPKHPLNPQSI